MDFSQSYFADLDEDYDENILNQWNLYTNEAFEDKQETKEETESLNENNSDGYELSIGIFLAKKAVKDVIKNMDKVLREKDLERKCKVFINQDLHQKVQDFFENTDYGVVEEKREENDFVTADKEPVFVLFLKTFFHHNNRNCHRWTPG